MSNIPTLKELEERASNHLIDELGLTDTELKSNLKALSVVMAATGRLLYMSLRDVQDNNFPATSYSERLGGRMEEHGRQILNRDPNPATTGTFSLSITGTSGTVLTSGLTFKSVDDNIYTLEDNYTLTGSSDVIEIVSDEAGSEYNLEIGNVLTVTSPVVGLDNEGTISEVIEQALAAETDEEYKAAMKLSTQIEAQGGSKGDYRIWSSDAQGVLRVYPYIKSGNGGTVQIYVEATKIDSSDGYGTPTATILEDVEDVIKFDPDETKATDERPRLPMQANLEVLEINLIDVEIDVNGLVDSSTSVRDSILTNVTAFLDTVRPFIDGVDLVRDKNDILYSGALQAAVFDSLDSGNYFTGFVMRVAGNVLSTYEFSGGNIPKIANINYL